MKRYLFCTALLFAWEATASSQVSFRADFLYLRRSEVNHHRLVEETFLTHNTTLLDTRDLVKDFKWRSGVRGVLRCTPDERSSLEASYTYITPWRTQKDILRPNSLLFSYADPNTMPDFTHADRAVARYRSDLQSAELGYWNHITPVGGNYFSCSWFFGGRWLLLRESFRLIFFKGSEESVDRIKTENPLYGLQMGAFLEVNPTPKWTWLFTLKGAAFLNIANNHLKLTDVDDHFTFQNLKKEHWAGSYLIEGEGLLRYHCGSSFSLEIGYQGLLIKGVALAPDQVKVFRRHVRLGGDVVVDGGFIGATLTY